MRQVTKDLKNLKETDIINILLYSIYKLSNLPEHAILSELMYTLDKESLLKFCSTFGGCTIKVPTLFELKTLLKTFLIIQYVNIDNMTFDEACETAEIGDLDKKKIIELYNILLKSIEDYTNG